ncbi:lipoyl(octanoyl) transferase LipB [Marichromatium bheemlicum]|uniref:Octanoyltransferase n=1 Tax=Marichromatium bheemlicum TaxID=365339 RepID=A0ABX1I899_9GAMM|nr:lipoyl(octanoyl) transferase LipB [Marichromatium bheemlicum]
MSETTETTPPQQLLIRRLPGLQDYAETLTAMRRFTDARDPHSLDELWLLEHPPVFTLGQAGRHEHLLATGDIPVVQVDRGGQVTYHGPGQLVAYLLFDLRRAGIGVKRLVNMLEQTVIELLNDYGVDAERRDNAPGVYVDGAKIASLGLRVRNARSYHGLALNVAMELEPFTRINPCGYAGLAMTQLSEYVAGIGVNDVANRLVDTLARVFELEPRWAR